jgi:pullulanase/glycogen debranching enzyme
MFINALILLSYGVPFFHMGQEYGQTKYGHENSYNAGDHYNMLDYQLRDSRIAMVDYFKELTKLRKMMKFFFELPKHEMLRQTTFEEFGVSALKITTIHKAIRYEVLINPALEAATTMLHQSMPLFVENGFVKRKNLVSGAFTLKGISVAVFKTALK